MKNCFFCIFRIFVHSKFAGIQKPSKTPKTPALLVTLWGLFVVTGMCAVGATVSQRPQTGNARCMMMNTTGESISLVMNGVGLAEHWTPPLLLLLGVAA